MKYFFILGNNPVLSIAEILAFFGFYNDRIKYKIINSSNVLILETDAILNPQKIIKNLGGVIKIGIINEEISRNNILEKSKKIIDKINIKTGKKFKFGISYYGKKKIHIKPIGMEIKKHLRKKEFSCRWVISKQSTLSSVVVEQNKLVLAQIQKNSNLDKNYIYDEKNIPEQYEGGIEIILIENNDHRILIGHTVAVQPFKLLSERDYGRPARDSHSGMLPPKLAQIMINLSNIQNSSFSDYDKKILDPFCGSGTIITEAMLMGYKNLIGSDISSRAVEDTSLNSKWIKEKYNLDDEIDYQIKKIDVSKISKDIPKSSIDKIIAEPYLGPQRGDFNIKSTVHELEGLYSKALEEFKKILKPNGTVVMVWPVFYIAHRKYNLNPNLGGFKIINFNLCDNSSDNHIKSNNINLDLSELNDNKLQDYKNHLSDRNTIIYSRPGQRVMREVVILRLF